MKDEVTKILENYYKSIDEDTRLIKDKAHNIEFLTTIHYIEKYLKRGNRILEIGAGTGRYSIYFAKNDYNVNAVELLESNIRIFNENIKNNPTVKLKMRLDKGNATDLSMFKNDTFDITLLLGPIYHLFNVRDKEKAISEALRVTKPNGKIFIAYITNETMIISEYLRKNRLKEIKNICDNNFRVIDNSNNIFSVSYISEFEKMMKQFDVRKLHQIGTDGISPHLSNYINNLDIEEFDIWFKYHLSTCERKDLLGYSSHILYIGEKI